MSALLQVNLLLREKRFSQAVDILSVLVNDSDFYLYHEKLSDALAGVGRIGDAIISLERALELQPSSRHLPKKLARLQALAVPMIGVAQHVGGRIEGVGKPEATGEPLDRITRFCGICDRYPDKTGRRLSEGGKRCRGIYATDTVDNPLVTVVTVVFNNDATLERCIKSVVAQDYQNIEYVIVDGGSRDGTLDVIKAYEDSIDYFVSEPDKGIYDAMNKGIELARGSYVCLLNSDDYYEPQFVSKSMATAMDKHSAIVYSNYYHGSLLTKTRGINEGVLLGHLNVNHSTFLVHRDCYDLVGPYSVDYRIVSDAIWMRKAFIKGIRFDLLQEALFTFAEDGLSSGSTEARRELFISEVIRSYRTEFEFLSEEEAEELYLVRFNNARLAKVFSIFDRYRDKDLFVRSLSCYIEYCFRERDNYRLHHTASRTVFPIYLQFCSALQIPRDSVRLSTRHGCFSELVRAIDERVSLRKTKPAKVILHFLSVFSAPSETFIYDLVTRLERDTTFDNYVLFEHRQLEGERPFAKSFWIPWGDFHEDVRIALYKHIFEALRPDVVVAHFALNAWKLEQRIKPIGIKVPMVVMTHGIDVFMLNQEGEYRDYVIKELAPRKDAFFSAVSSFLKNRLVDYGVPPEKISLISNTVNPRFYANRKTGGSYRKYGAPVRLLAVGRLIDWKGHRFLIQALAKVKEEISEPVSLTIVFGNGRDVYEDIVAQIKALRLESNVDLVPFVDFSKEPGYYNNFDLFVHPSTYSNDDFRRTETFGVSVLEAIASGLPVIATDAGGIPEVIGESNRFARIVPHADSDAMAKAIVASIRDQLCFGDNSAYADQRLALFSEKQQIVELAKLVFQTCQDKLKVAIFSASTVQGAGYAAYRLHRGLSETSCIQPEIFTTVRNHESTPGVRRIQHPSGDARQWQILQSTSISKPHMTIFTLNHPIITNRTLSEWVNRADVINIHWSARFLSIENIAFLSRSNKPVVMTIRDMNPLTGGCHFFHGCEEWTRNCTGCPQLVDTLDDFPAKILEAKRKYYDFSNITLVALSRHTAEIVSRAPYFRDCRLEIIPNSIETEVFTPTDKRHAREILGLPTDRQIVGYLPSFSSEVKGYNQMQRAFVQLESQYPQLDPLVLLLGNKTPATDAISLDKHILGYISDNEKLALAYSAADVIVVPSLEETFSNTTAEAISCGTPVVGFKTGAIPEMVQDGVTGYTYSIGDTNGLVEGIKKVLTGPDLSSNCRRYAEKHLRFDIQAERYEKLYMELAAYRTRNSIVIETKDSFPETNPTVLRLLECRSRDIEPSKI